MMMLQCDVAHPFVYWDTANSSLRHCVIQQPQDSDLDLTLGVVRQVSKVGQETDEKVEIGCFVRTRAGEYVADIWDWNNGGIGQLLFRRRVLLPAILLLGFMLQNFLLLLLLNFLYALPAGLVDELLATLIRRNVVLADDLNASVIVKLLNVLSGLLGLLLEILRRRILAG